MQDLHALPIFPDLRGKTILITGASSGMGAATARALAHQGARVGLAARRRDVLENLAAEIRATGGEALVIPTDITREAELEAAVARCCAHFGRLDGAFNNAGALGRGAPLHQLDNADYQEVMGTNLEAMFQALKHQIPALLAGGGGAIVNNASVVAQVGFAHASLYTASKHGVLGLTRAAALEYYRQGIRINAVLPGPIETPMAVGGFGGKDQLEAALQSLPPGRPGQPEEVAAAVLFLLSSSASYISGQGLAVDGGYTVQ
jgi:NAD(P)-dependent dehydrogenase (short-subunit alcohol dehydrogenase family)